MPNEGPSEQPAQERDMLQCITMCGSDNRMDARNMWEPLNGLPLKCHTCGMCDLDFVPQPYFLCKGLNNPAHIQQAEMGNLLVRSRVKEILKTVAPGQCVFYPTFAIRSKAQTDWFLAVPQNQLVTATLKLSIPRCSDCGEPQTANGTQYEDLKPFWSPVALFDIFKSRNWISGMDTPVHQLAGRVDRRAALLIVKEAYFSLRLELLLRKAGVRGLCRFLDCPEQPSPTDHKWAREQFAKIEALNGEVSNHRTDEWFTKYLNRSSRNEKAFDFAAAEQACGVQLPAAYKDFVQCFGRKKYRDVDGEEGFHVTVLPPNALSCDEFRAAIREDTSDVLGCDGIVFAEARHGDMFCFKVEPIANADYEVYRYDHEIMDFEPYAKNFAGCIQSWAQR